MKRIPTISMHRRHINRCESLKVELTNKRRSWRCQLVLGHEGPHVSFSGHRSWTLEVLP